MMAEDFEIFAAGLMTGLVIFWGAFCGGLLVHRLLQRRDAARRDDG